MRNFNFTTALAYVDIPPQALAPTPSEIRESKIKSALARLGDRWVLAPTRSEQLAQLYREGWDLA